MERPSTPTKDMKDLYPGTPTVGTPGHFDSKSAPVDDRVTIVGLRQIDMTIRKKLHSKIGIRGKVEKTATLGTITHGVNNKVVNFFGINLCDDVCLIVHLESQQDGNKIRVSGFDENSKHYTSFTAGSTVRIEEPLVTILNAKYANGANIRYELRLVAASRVVVEVDNSYSHVWYASFNISVVT